MRRLLIALAVVALVGLSGCGGGEQRYALAIESAHRMAEGTTLTTECAELDEAEVAPDPEGSGLDVVTIWGRPKVGRCRLTLDLLVPLDDKFIDAATSQVVEVDPA